MTSLSALSKKASARKRRRRPPSVLEPPLVAGNKLAGERVGNGPKLFLRENPVPMILGALVAGLAIGLAIHYTSRSEKRSGSETPLGRIKLERAFAAVSLAALPRNEREVSKAPRIQSGRA